MREEGFLSTVLRVIKLYEKYRDRRRVEFQFTSTSDPTVGNTLAIQNISDTHIIINHWAIYQKRRWIPFSTKSEIVSKDFDDANIKIPAHDEHVMEFNNQDYFKTSYDKRGKGNMYVRLNLATGKLVKRRIFKFK